jgi:flagellar basal-body rod protein FlgG
MKGIYTPLSGALAQDRVLQVLANNMANVSTNGFKGEDVVFSVVDPEPYKNYPSPVPPANYKVGFDKLTKLHGNEHHYVAVADVHKDLAQGPAISTSNPSDLMVQGAGYFSISTPDGVRYTRDGSFTRQPGGALTTADGNPVLGENGAVFLGSAEFTVNAMGEIYQKDVLVDRLKLVSFDNPQALEKVGSNQLIYNGEEAEIREDRASVVHQGKIEGSNVNPMKNMTDLIVAHRSFEAYQKAMQNFDSMMEKSANQIGVVQA